MTTVFAFIELLLLYEAFFGGFFATAILALHTSHRYTIRYLALYISCGMPTRYPRTNGKHYKWRPTLLAIKKTQITLLTDIAWGIMMTKPQICVTIEKEYKEWLEKKVKNKVYGSNSHAIEVLIRNEMKKEGLIKDE